MFTTNAKVLGVVLLVGAGFGITGVVLNKQSQEIKTLSQTPKVILITPTETTPTASPTATLKITPRASSTYTVNTTRGVK